MEDEPRTTARKGRSTQSVWHLQVSRIVNMESVKSVFFVTYNCIVCNVVHTYIIIIIIIVTSFAPMSSKIKLSGATKPGD